MLTTLSIQNIVLIDSLTIDFSNGLCVMTGETGAGKSIILDALGLILGKRATSSLVRHGAHQAAVSAEFTIPDKTEVKTILEEQGLELEDNTVIIRRLITKEGKSKAFINDQIVGQGTLRTIAEHLVEIHGQHENRGLLDPKNHRLALDTYGKHDIELAATKAAYNTYNTLKKQRDSIKEQAERAKQEEDYLRHIAKELKDLAPETGEEETLTDKRTTLMRKEKTLSTLKKAINELTEPHHLASAIQSAQRILMRSTESDTSCYQNAIDALERASIEVNEALGTLESTLYDLDHNEDNLDSIEERLFALRAAAKKYNRPVDDLVLYQQEINQKLTLIEDQERHESDLAQKLQQAKQDYTTASADLTAKRHQSAQRLEKAMHATLPPLKMENAQFHIAIDPSEHYSPAGSDTIHFTVSLNPGTPLGPIEKLASGGELARFMLALKAVLADTKAIPTMIFDEVDTGIGGAVADAVGSKLQQLAEETQVLVITHQPQVAAKASQHLKVQKYEKDQQTFTTVTELLPEQQQEELARMLSGNEITPQAREAAKALKHQ